MHGEFVSDRWWNEYIETKNYIKFKYDQIYKAKFCLNLFWNALLSISFGKWCSFVEYILEEKKIKILHLYNI